MKLFFVILFSIFSINIFAQSNDSLKTLTNYNYNNINIFYERNANMLIINGINENTYYTIQLFDITGTPILNSTYYSSSKNIEFSIPLKNGIYIINLKYQNYSITRKFKVNN